jgi:hypothetical protein
MKNRSCKGGGQRGCIGRETEKWFENSRDSK